MAKKNQDPPTPAKSAASPKKVKSPPQKKESDMNLATGQQFEIRMVRCITGENLYKVVNDSDTTDAFVRRIATDALKDATHELPAIYKIKGDLHRRQGLDMDEPLKNAKNRWTRNYFVQYSAEDGESTIFQKNTAKAIKKVSTFRFGTQNNKKLTMLFFFSFWKGTIHTTTNISFWTVLLTKQPKDLKSSTTM